MPRALTVQASHTYGVLDPLVIERRDTKFVAASLSDACNVISLPQGGYVDRGGTTRRAKVRRRFEPVTVSLSMLSAPNGGFVSALTDGDSTTSLETSAVSGSPFDVVEVDLGAATDISAVDLLSFKASTADRDDCVIVRYFGGSGWTDLGEPFHLRTSARSRRFAVPPGTAPISTRYLRMVITGGSGPGAISLGGIEVFVEGSTKSDAILRAFNRDETTRYQLIVTERNLDVFKDGVWQVALPATWISSQLRTLKLEADYDTILWFSQLAATRKLVRAGSDREWNLSTAPWQNLPRVDYGGTYTNGVNEKQRITFYEFSGSAQFELILEGNKTDAITWSSDHATLASHIKDALEELPGVEPGLTVTVTPAGRVDIEFTGGANAARDWEQITAVATAPSTYVSTATIQKGKAAGEDIMSADRGWLNVGRYAQERLVGGGIPASPGTVLASVPGEPFNFDMDIAGPIAALSYDIAGEANTVCEVFFDITLVIFTPSAVYSQASPKMLAEEAPEIRKSRAPGIDERLPALSLADAIYYVQNGGRAIMALNYSELGRNFLGDNASVLSAFLVAEPIDWTTRRATAGNDADLLVYINSDGRMVTVTLLRSQEVSGFMPHETDGKFVSLCTDGKQNMWFVVERETADGPQLFFEQMEPGKLGDGGLEFSFGSPRMEITGLAEFEGQVRHVFSGGKWIGEFPVSAGKITLPKPVTSARVASWTAPRATDTPFQPEEENRAPLSRKKRVYGLDVSVMDTEALAVQVNGGAVYPHPLNAPFTGTIMLEGFPGFTADAMVTVTQTRPGRLKVRMVKKRIAA